MVPFLSMEKSQCVKNGENLRLLNFTMCLLTQLSVTTSCFNQSYGYAFDSSTFFKYRDRLDLDDGQAIFFIAITAILLVTVISE